MKYSALEFYVISVYGVIGYLQWESMDESYETISECSSYTLTNISVN